MPREAQRIQVVWTDGVKGLVLPDVCMCVESPPAARTSAYDACSRAFELCTHIPTYPLHPSSTCPTRSFARAALHPASCPRPRQRQVGTAARRHSAKAWALGVAVAAVASRTYFSRAVGMAPAHEPRRGRTRPLSDESLPFERGGVIRHSARVNTSASSCLSNRPWPPRLSFLGKLRDWHSRTDARTRCRGSIDRRARRVDPLERGGW